MLRTSRVRIGRRYRSYKVADTPPLPSNLIAWYKSSAGTLDAVGASADNYEVVANWQDQRRSALHLSQATGAKRPKYRSFGRKAIYADAANVHLNQPDIEIDQQSFSFFCLVDQADQFVNSGGATRVLLEIVGVGTLRGTVASQGVVVLTWVDGAGTHNTSLKPPAGLSLIGVVLSASAVTIWCNDASESFGALDAGTATGINLLNNAAGTGIWAGGAQEVILYDTALDAGVKAQLDVYAQARGCNYLSNTSRILASHGASISTYQLSEDLLGFIAQANRGNCPLYILGAGGLTYANIASLYAFTDAVYDINKRCVLWVNAGQNEIGSGTAAATVTANRRAYIARQRDKGWLVIENNVAPSSAITAGEETVRTTVNSDMAADSIRRYANFVCTVPAELSDHTDTDYFSVDGIHWTHAGHAAMLAQGQAALTTLLGTPLEANLMQAAFSFDGNVLDSTAYTRDLEAINNPAYAAGVGGHQCLVCASSGNKHARYTLSANVFPWLPITVMLWVKTTVSPTATIVSTFDGAGKGWKLNVNTDGKLGGFYLPDLGGGNYCGTIISTSIINDGEWHAVAYTVDSSGSKIYVSPDDDPANLVLENTGAWTGTPQAMAGNTSRLYVGSDNGSASIDLSIQMMRIFAQVLTLEELQALTP